VEAGDGSTVRVGADGVPGVVVEVTGVGGVGASSAEDGSQSVTSKPTKVQTEAEMASRRDQPRRATAWAPWSAS
jgi:hypothetical protein